MTANIHRYAFLDSSLLSYLDVEGNQQMEAALREAAARGDEVDVRHYIRRQADVNAADADGNTPLHFAAREGHSTVVVILLRESAHVDAQNLQGETPLHLAARGGDLESVRVLLKFGADRNIEDNNGRTPLFVAMREQHSDVAAALLPKSADSHASDGDGVVVKQADEQRFREAAEAGDVRTIGEMLEETEVDIDAVDDQHHTALYRAASYNRTDVVELLLKKGANPNIPDRSGKTPLHVASAENHSKIVKMLLERVRDVDVRDVYGATSMCLAGESGAADVVKPLVDAGADVNLPNNNEETPLWAAAAGGHDGFVRRLIEETHRSNTLLIVDAAGFLRGRTPLHLAADRGDVHMAAVLLDAGAEKEMKDSGGYTPLLLASAAGRARMVRYLLDKGVHINAINDREQTSLFVSAFDGNVPVTRVLLSRGADTEAADTEGQTPLIAAAQEGHVAIVGELLKASAEIETANDDGETPLMMAAKNGYQNTVALLVRHEADFEAVRNDGKTALHLAVRDGHVGVVNVLLSAAKTELEAADQKTLMASPLHLAADTQGETALHIAARFRQASAVALLLDYDAFFHEIWNGTMIYGKLIHQQNVYGWTAMHGAVDRAHRGAVQLLLDHDADVGAADIYGNTPVHLAARGIDHRLLSDVLRADGAQTAAVNVEGRTPLHFASACIRPLSASTLLENGADPLSADVFRQQPLDLLGNAETCNPERARNEGLCDYALDRPDMCSITLGDETELTKTKSLLEKAVHRHDRTHSDRLTGGGSQSVGRPTSSTDSVQMPVYVLIIPVFILMLLVALGVWMIFKRKSKDDGGIRCHFGFSSRRLKHKQEQAELERMESAMQYAPPLPRKNTFDAMTSILNQPVNLSEESRMFESLSSESDSSCGWSDATDELERSAQESAGRSRGEKREEPGEDGLRDAVKEKGVRDDHRIHPIDAEYVVNPTMPFRSASCVIEMLRKGTQ